MEEKKDHKSGASETRNAKSEVVVRNFMWRFFERCGAEGVSLIISIVLARLLTPDIFGTVALVITLTTILQVFVDSGLGNALIQKKNADDLDFSTVFYFNIAVCTVLYSALFLCAPLLVTAFGKEGLTASMVRVMGLIIVVSGLKNVQQAYVSRHMLFKRFFFATLGGTIGAAVIGITMAINGFGAWSYICQLLFNTTVDTTILWITVKWRPKLMFSLKRLKSLFSFGWKLLVSQLIETGYNELRSLVIGLKYKSSDLGHYNKGKQFPNMIVKNINNSIDSVLLPSMSSVQDDKARVKAMTRRSIKISSYLMWPIMAILGVCAEPIVRIILTEKWLPCVPYMRIFCFTYAFYPIHTANLNAIKAMGRSDVFLILEIIKKVIGIIVLIISVFIADKTSIGVLAIAYSLLLTTFIGQIVNSWPNRKLLGYGYLEQLLDILPSIIMAVFAGTAVLGMRVVGDLAVLPDIVVLVIQPVVGMIVYWAGSILFRFESYRYLEGAVKGFAEKLHKKKTKVKEG